MSYTTVHKTYQLLTARFHLWHKIRTARKLVHQHISWENSSSWLKIPQIYRSSVKAYILNFKVPNFLEIYPLLSYIYRIYQLLSGL